MKRVLSTLRILLIVMLPASALALDLNLDKLVNTLSKVKDLKTAESGASSDVNEVEIGKGIAASLLGASPLVTDQKLQDYLNRLGWWIVLQGERTELPWRFGVIESEQVNAFSTPGGYVFITRGLLLRMRSEAELAGVLAHEIAHVLKKHHLNAIRKSAQTGLVADLASAAVGRDDTFGLSQKLINVGTDILVRGLDKQDEFEADRLAVVLAARAGYDPYGLPSVLQMLDAMNPGDSGLSLLFKTHPAPQKRLEQLDLSMGNTLDRFAGQAGGESRFMQVVGDYAKR